LSSIIADCVTWQRKGVWEKGDRRGVWEEEMGSGRHVGSPEGLLQTMCHMHGSDVP